MCIRSPDKPDPIYSKPITTTWTTHQKCLNSELMRSTNKIDKAFPPHSCRSSTRTLPDCVWFVRWPKTIHLARFRYNYAGNPNNSQQFMRQPHSSFPGPVSAWMNVWFDFSLLNGFWPIQCTMQRYVVADPEECLLFSCGKIFGPRTTMNLCVCSHRTL